MSVIRPSADLRNNYNEISKICHETGEPVFITKNGANDLVVLSNEKYDEMTEETIDRLITEKFDKKFKDFESFKEDLYKHIEIGLQQIKDGDCQPAREFFKEMEEKYDIK